MSEQTRQFRANSGTLRSAFVRIAEAMAYFVGIIVLWEVLIVALSVPEYVFPAPSAIFIALWNGLVSGNYLWNLGVTTTEVLLGFALGSLAGFLLGVAMVTSATIDRIFYPYVVAIQTIPKVAIAPLMIVWFGFGIQSKIILVALACVFPVLINTMAGLRSTESDRVSLLKSMCATRFQLLRFVQFPSALPYIFAGLNTAVVLAVIGAVVGEFVGARVGIGVLILQANFALDLASVFALLILLSILGIILNFAMRSLERRICFWSGKTSK